MATRESVYKLRTNKFGESRTSSISNLHSPGRNQLKNRESSKKFEGSMERKDLSKTGAKVYYSDKSESSVEDLMDETPSNYNIPNGRLDGKSIGFRFGRDLIKKASSPDLIDNY